MPTATSSLCVLNWNIQLSTQLPRVNPVCAPPFASSLPLFNTSYCMRGGLTIHLSKFNSTNNIFDRIMYSMISFKIMHVTKKFMTVSGVAKKKLGEANLATLLE